jgi:hypothetical protein
MGDPRHKKPPPPSDKEEIIRDSFRQKVRDILEANEQLNRLRGKKRGQDGYLISNRAELADACGTDTTMINKIIGPARETSKVDLVDRSTFIDAIRVALGISETTIFVPMDRVTALEFLAALPDDKFKVFDDEVKRLMRESGRVPA